MTERRERGNGQVWVIGTVSGSAFLGLVTLMFTFIQNTAKDAQIAVDVAAQHGGELNVIRGEMAAMRNEMLSTTNERYTAVDAEKHNQYVERRLRLIEKRLEQLDERQ